MVGRDKRACERRPTIRDCAYFLSLFAYLTTLATPAIGAPPASASPGKDEPLLRGPLHEAFAAPLAGADRPGAIVAGRPGPPLDELPTAVKPAAANAVWIPGYWGWEPAVEEFIWVPGIWRLLPPGMRWVPGYWTTVEDGSRWVRGFWYPVKEARLRYLPPPPKHQEERLASPDAHEHFTVPGHWIFVQGQFRWARGFTAHHKSDWIWMPSHYIWTPRGAIFAPGYWDRALGARGLAFAPVRGPNDGRSAFTPSVALNISDLPEALFVGAGFGHYYFGDYFDGGLANELTPWCTASTGPSDDPLFAYERWRQRAVPDWAQSLTKRYQRRRDDEQLRPPVRFSKRSGDAGGNDVPPKLGLSVSAWGRSQLAGPAATELSPDAVRRVSQNSAGTKVLAIQRAKFEGDGAPATAETPLAFYLPAPTESQERIDAGQRPRTATAGQFVPGVAGRDVPGTGGETLPGMRGRTVPGVDIHVPGATAPGVLPGADSSGELPE